MKVASLYIHVPFCKRRCAYCTFYHVSHVDRFEERFVESLIDEFRSAVLDFGGELSLPTVFLGGGTPSVLSAGSLERIFNAIGPYAADGGEVTVEANPEDVGAEMLDHLVALGVNRLSLGIQSMVPRALRVLKRCSDDVNARAIELVSSRFDNFSIDLVLGVPDGSIDEVRQSMHRLGDAEATHYSVYCLEPGGVMAAPEIDRFFDDVDPERSAEEYLYVCDALADLGYDHYEVSNFAKPGFESRHNRAYWRGGDYLGIGPGAHSFIDGERWYNEPSIERYTAGDSSALRCVERRGADERRTEELMLALRTSDGLAIDHAACESGVIDDLVASRLAARRGNRLFLTDRGFLLLNEILLRVARAA